MQVEQEPADSERPRFGINSLINRMTGHGQQPEAPVRRTAPPPVQSSAAAPARAPAPEADEDQERIEIPAFLRRQAN
jgi:cell division protein FtsZ